MGQALVSEAFENWRLNSGFDHLPMSSFGISNMTPGPQLKDQGWKGIPLERFARRVEDIKEFKGLYRFLHTVSPENPRRASRAGAIS